VPKFNPASISAAGKGGARPGSGRPKVAATRRENLATMAERHALEVKTLLKRQARDRAALVAKIEAKLSEAPEAPAVTRTTKVEPTAPKRPRGRPFGSNAINMALRREAEAKLSGDAGQ
jgi:hypothetical protein